MFGFRWAYSAGLNWQEQIKKVRNLIIVNPQKYIKYLPFFSLSISLTLKVTPFCWLHFGTSLAAGSPPFAPLSCGYFSCQHRQRIQTWFVLQVINGNYLHLFLMGITVPVLGELNLCNFDGSGWKCKQPFSGNLLGQTCRGHAFNLV